MLEELTVRKVVEFAIKTEELGGFYYHKLADRFSEDKELSSVFALLGEDEGLHRQQLRKLLETVPEERLAESTGERLRFLKAMSKSEFFVGENGLYRNISEIKSREDALDRALRFEKDTLGYYQAMRDALGANQALDELIEFEKGHVTKVVEYIITGAKMRGLSDEYSGGPA